MPEFPRGFEGAEFLGAKRGTKQDLRRLALFSRNLRQGEYVRALLPIRGGTLLLTNQRLMEMKPHLAAHGFWNVREFQGYHVESEVLLGDVIEAGTHFSLTSAERPGFRKAESQLVLRTKGGTKSFVVSRGVRARESDTDLKRFIGLMRSLECDGYEVRGGKDQD